MAVQLGGWWCAVKNATARPFACNSCSDPSSVLVVFNCVLHSLHKGLHKVNVCTQLDIISDQGCGDVLITECIARSRNHASRIDSMSLYIHCHTSCSLVIPTPFSDLDVELPCSLLVDVLVREAVDVCSSALLHTATAHMYIHALILHTRISCM